MHRTERRSLARRVWHLGRHARQQRTQKSRAYLWCDPAKVGAKPVIGVNAQSGKANIILLSRELGVALDSAQAQALMEANQAMIEGGGFTASDVSFQLASMKVLGTLEHRFNIKSWRVLDESDESGDRYVQASMQLSMGDSAIATTRQKVPVPWML